MRLQIKIKDKQHLIKAVLKTISAIYDLTKTDLDVLEKIYINSIINKTTRKLIQKELNMSVASVNNYVTRLKKKGLLIEVSKHEYSCNALISNSIEEQSIEFIYGEAV
jgi:predicted transcriptional regulator